jgi:hypothetical protein
MHAGVEVGVSLQARCAGRLGSGRAQCPREISPVARAVSQSRAVLSNRGVARSATRSRRTATDTGTRGGAVWKSFRAVLVLPSFASTVASALASSRR